MINVIVITCDYGHIHELVNNELFSDPEIAKKRFTDLIHERHNSVIQAEIETALEKGVHQIGYTTILISTPVRR